MEELNAELVAVPTDYETLTKEDLVRVLKDLNAVIENYKIQLDNSQDNQIEYRKEMTSYVDEMNKTTQNLVSYYRTKEDAVRTTLEGLLALAKLDRMPITSEDKN